MTFLLVVAQLIKNQLAMQERPWLIPGSGRLKNPPCNMGDLGLIPGLERSPGGGHGNPFLYSCLKNSQGQMIQRSTVDGVAKSQTSERLSTEQYNIES